jgi:hypothetical protein
MNSRRKNRQSPISYLQSLIFFLFIFLLSSCKTDENKRILPDISNIAVPEVKIQRFERDLFSMDTLHINESYARLSHTYPEFSDFFFNKILGGEQVKLPPMQNARLFVNSSAIKNLYDTCQIAYKDITDIEHSLTQAFKYYKYYFPNKPTPKVVSGISEYSNGVFSYGDSLLYVGWDFFLGANHRAYPAIFPKYICKTLSRPYLVPQVTETLVNDIAGNPSGERLLDEMIHNGKKLYIIDQLLPTTADSLKLGYSKAQTDWCANSESQIWAFFTGENLLYSTKRNDIGKYLNAAPTSPGMPAESPGRTANYIGWQIVKSYMKRYPDTSLETLIGIRDAQDFLEKAKYKPKR